MENLFEQECNFEMKWIIPREKFNELKKKSIHHSDIFQAYLPGVSYSLRLDPDGNFDFDDGQTRLYLGLYKGMMESVQCDFTISIQLTSVTKTFTNNFESTGTWGGIIASKEQLSNPAFIGGDKLIFEVKGTMKGKGLKVEERKGLPLIQLMSERNEMDVTVSSGDQEYKIHKYIFASRSPVFKVLLDQDESETLKLSEFSPSIVKAVIDFCYDKDIKDQITANNATEFFRFSDKYEMNDLKNTVESFFVQHLSDENVCQLAKKSVEFNANKLRECCICFLLLKKSDEILNLKNWGTLDKEICKEIIQRALTFVSKNCF